MDFDTDIMTSKLCTIDLLIKVKFLDAHLSCEEGEENVVYLGLKTNQYIRWQLTP